MMKGAFFLALKTPGDKLRFYQERLDAKMFFHFVDFKAQKPLKIGIQEVEKPEPFDFFYKPAQLEPSKDAQIALLKNTIKKLEQDYWSKVVISRFHSTPLKGSVESLLKALADKHPEASVYLFSHPESGTWIGASPENLLTVRKNKVEIASLAGTRLWSDRDSFNSKEREEQAIVTANIYQLLETTKGLSDIKKSPVTFHKAGHLAHLLTNISAEADPSFQAWHLLQTLHPTPAVGGEPKKLAIDYINEQELYERRYYSGYFGLENQSHNIANYWVNLRCAELVDTANLAVYVGGGITAKSKAEEEWAETEAKTQTILNAMIDRNK